LFSQTTEYALRAMAWLALSPDGLVPTITLAEQTNVPVHYLAKVLQQLSGAGLVVGRRGVRGGYRLARSAEAISMLDVVRAAGDVKRITAGPAGPADDGTVLGPLHRMMDDTSKVVMDLLHDKTLQDLVTQAGTSKPGSESIAISVASTPAGQAKLR
jgi:Rrf2 family protein